MSVIFERPVMAFAMPRVRDDGTLVTLAIVNASIDRQDPVVVRLRGVSADVKVALWHQPEADGVVALAVSHCNGEARVRLPRIGAWECGYLSFGAR